MSDDRIVSLDERRASPPRKLAATLVFGNHRLRMPVNFRAAGPEWVVDEVAARFDERADEVTVYPRFGMLEHSPDGTSGRVAEHGHGVQAELYFERDIFLALQGAALSSRPLTLFVTFLAEDGCSPSSLALAIEQRAD